MEEFIYWLDNREYNSPNAVKIEGFTAEQIAIIEPTLDASGVYSLLVTLRDNKDKALKYINNGFPRK